MYLSKAYILTAISKISGVHPFYGITFLSCKKNGLPVGKKTSFQMDKNTKVFMDEVHKLDPVSGFYFQPYTSNARDKCWVKLNYPSTGLQAINTQTFADAFLHIKKEKTWAWSENYLDILVSQLKNGELIPTFDLAVWVLKDRKWSDHSTPESIVQTFVELFGITDEESAKAAFSHIFVNYNYGERYMQMVPDCDGD